MEQCRACGCSLKRARSVSSKLHGHGISQLSLVEGVKKSLNVNVTPGKNVCGDCFNKISKLTVLSEKVSKNKKELSTQKRKLSDSGVFRNEICSNISSISTVSFSPSPIAKRMCFSPRKATCSTPKTVKPKHTSLIDTIVRQVQNTNYDSAIRTMMMSKKANGDIKKFIGLRVQDEVRAFSKKITSLRQILTLESIDKFSWEGFLNDVDTGLPFLTSLLRSVLTTRRTKDKISCLGNKIGPLVPAFGLLVGVILHHRFPSQFKFIQQIISIQMFRSGCNHKMFRWFHKFGLCMSVNTTRQLVDRLGQDYDNKVKEWKQNIEENVLHVLPSPVPDTRNEESGWSSLSESESEVEPSDTDEDQDEEQATEDLSMVMEDTILYSESDDEQDFVPFPDIFETNEILGYSLCWDNVQKMSVARHQSRHSGNKMLLWANCFATLDRVNLTSLSCNWEETVTAGSIDLKNFLPSDDDWKQLQTRMEVIVQRILTNVLDLDLPVEQHISHKFSNESAGKSQVVNLGVIKENPSTCKGVIEIMKNLHRYTPKDEDGKPWPVICHGDQLSVERMVEGKIAMSTSTLPEDRLEGLIPRPQNFHKRVILLQVTLDTLFGKGACDKGTLTQINNVFGHRNVKKKASDCMNHLTDFMDFVTEGHILLLAAHLRPSGELKQLLTSSDEVSTLAREIVQFIKPQVNEYIAGVDDDRNYTCICNEEDGGAEWIECSSTVHCETRWFHKDCVDVSGGAEEDDWWCSSDCQAKGLSAYCCGRQLDNTDWRWIQCASRSDCIQREWFHSVCVGLKENQRIWYCSESCRTSKEIDHKQAYAMNVLWRGLMHMTERDAERENDGRAMISLWKLNILDFWEHGHYKYLTLAFRLLASVNGWMPKRIAENLIWNSTANLRGEAGCNIPLDLINEFLNNEFKTNLKRIKGQYTDSAVQRCSLISGTIGKGLEEKFMSQVVDKYIGRSKSVHVSHKRDLNKFVKVYKGECLFQHVPGRHHSAYEHFVHHIPLKSPSKLKDRLVKYGVKLDTERLLCK